MVKTGRLQKKIAEILILLTIVHTVLLGTYFGFVIAGNIKNEVQNTIDVRNAQISTQVDHINELVSRYSTALLENENIRSIITTCDFSKDSYYTSIASMELDRFFGSLFANSYDAKGCIVFSEKGNTYVFRNALDEVIFPQKDLKSMKNTLSATSGQIVWLGKQTFKNLYNEKEDYFIVGRSLRDLSDERGASFEKIADIIYLFKMKDLTPFNINSENHKEIMIVLNPKKEIGYSSLDKETTDGITAELMTSDGELKTEFSTVNYKSLRIFAKTSVTSLTGWYVIAGNGDFHLENEILKAIGIMISIFLIGIFFVNLLFNIEIKKLFRPIKSITDAMEKIGKKDFNIHLEAENAGELGVICDGINQMSQELDSLFKKTVLIEKQKKTEQIKALQYQMNPHFLYNTLASLKMLAIQHDEETIAQNIEALSRLLRNTISRSTDLITIEDELDNIKDYICLQQFRYKDGVEVVYDTDAEVFEASIPNLLMQPLVENAIMHGLSEKINCRERAILKISAKKENDNVRITIYDNGVGFDKNNISHNVNVGNNIGIKNINDRIKLIFGEEYGLTIKSEISYFTEAQIIIPYKKLSETEGSNEKA